MSSSRRCIVEDAESIENHHSPAQQQRQQQMYREDLSALVLDGFPKANGLLCTLEKHTRTRASSWYSLINEVPSLERLQVLLEIFELVFMVLVRLCPPSKSRSDLWTLQFLLSGDDGSRCMTLLLSTIQYKEPCGPSTVECVESIPRLRIVDADVPALEFGELTSEGVSASKPLLESQWLIKLDWIPNWPLVSGVGLCNVAQYKVRNTCVRPSETQLDRIQLRNEEAEGRSGETPSHDH